MSETRAVIWFQKVLFWEFQNSRLKFTTTNGMQKLIFILYFGKHHAPKYHLLTSLWIYLIYLTKIYHDLDWGHLILAIFPIYSTLLPKPWGQLSRANVCSVVLGAPANCTTTVIKMFIVYQNQWTSYQMLLGNKILSQF